MLLRSDGQDTVVAVLQDVVRVKFLLDKRVKPFDLTVHGNYTGYTSKGFNLHIANDLDTDAGRAMGKQRHEALVAFLDAFFAEWDATRAPGPFPTDGAGSV